MPTGVGCSGSSGVMRYVTLPICRELSLNVAELCTRMGFSQDMLYNTCSKGAEGFGRRCQELSKDAALFSKAALPNALSFVNKPCRELMRL